MAEIKLTQAQQAVVDHSGGALLVSAAAGSGKTKVLVDRLMRMVCDRNQPRDVSDFLMITYTKAAASELRAKISAELSRRLAEEPDNRHLRRQMNLIYAAEISTIHAFCANLLRTYAHILDIPSDFRVAEETECAVLRQRALEQCLEEAYGRIAQDADLLALVDVFGMGRDDRAVLQAVSTLYDAVQCHPYPDDWMDGCCAALDLGQYLSCEQTPWGAYLMARFHAFVSAQRTAMAGAMTQMQGIPELEKAYLPVFEENDRLLAALENADSWDAVVDAIPDSFGRLGAVRKFDDKALLEDVKGVRSRCLEELRKWKESFYGPSAECMADLAVSAAALRGAFSLVRRMSKLFQTEKRRRRMLDFGDLEHFSIRLLIDHTTGRPTAAAHEISERFTEIMVDEYQDSNEIQDLIFAAISKDGKNRFMVGDVKQSIYRFRLADPTIFLEKYRTFHDYRQAGPDDACKILLSENFRSRHEVLEAVNHVFRTVMSDQVGDLAYTDDESLKPGLHFEDTIDPMVELHCLETGSDEDGGGKTETEAAFVARRIAQMLTDGTTVTEGGNLRPVQAGDIVILLRSVGSAAPAYLDALHSLGIPCISDRGESLLDTEEAEVFQSILQALDNPRDDIALAAALSSPVYAFSAGELAQMRAGCRKGDFYDALQCHGESNQKTAAFLEGFNHLREQARWMPAQDLLRLVYEQTNIEAVYGAMSGGQRRVENLQTIFEFFQSCTADGKSLMEMNAHIAQLRQRGMALSPAGETGGAVTIMSIHKSKGLEFPVVFLSDLSRRFNTEDLRENVMTHPRLFAASSVVDTENAVRFPTIGKKAIALCKQSESLSEELRVLYVAMTRARERLIMTYCSKYLQNELCTIAAGCAEPVSADFAARARNPGWWVLMAALCRTEAGELFQYGSYPKASAPRQYPWRIRLHRARTTDAPIAAVETEEPETTQPMQLTLPTQAEILQAVQFCYSHVAATAAPSKVTATQLKGRIQDEEAAQQAKTLLPHHAIHLRRPDFEQARHGLNAMEQGTANHLFLQFASYDQCRTETGVQAELHRMVYEEFLTPQQAEAVRVGQIVHLFQSSLGARIYAANQVIREFKFSVLVDAGDYYPDTSGEQLMLQGVVDCMLEESACLTVIDFKTDMVKPGQTSQRAEVYRPQLEAYGVALERIFRKPVRQRILYFLAAGESVVFE